MPFGILNTVLPPAPSVNTVDYNTILVCGIAPKGPKNVLTLCATDTEDSVFGSCLTGFTIPRALSDIRYAGGGKVIVINVFDESTHTVQVTNENDTVTSQKTKITHNPTNAVTVKNTPVSPVAAQAATAALAVTVAPTSGDVLTDIEVDGTSLFASALTFDGTSSASVTAAKTAIVSAINAHTGTSGFSATSGSGGAFTITAPTSLGADVNGVVSEPVILAGTIVFGTNNAFTGGVTQVVEVVAVTYVKDTDYTIDDYGNIKFLIAIADGTVIRTDYKRLNISLVQNSEIVGTVSGSTRTGLKLADMCSSTLNIVPKIMIVPKWNAEAGVKTEMERVCSEFRMRTFYTSTSGVTLAQAKASRNPGGTIPNFNQSSKRANLFYPMVKTYDPQTGTNTLTDASALLAGFVSWNAAINGPHESPSNRIMPSCAGAEVELLHKWEDVNSAADTNQLRSNGIACVFNDGGYILWGSENASYPDNTAVDANFSVMYVNDIITDSLTVYATKKIDRNITNGSIQAFLTEANAYYTTLKTSGWIGPDSEVKYYPERNNNTDLQAGKIVFTRLTYYFVGMKYIVLEESMAVQLPNIQTQ